MKIPPAKADRFVSSPDPSAFAVLVYGPDAGLVRERCNKLVCSVVDDAADPFRVSEFNASVLKDDPARLSDEASALSLIGGRRVVYLRGAGDGETAALKGILEDGRSEALIVVQGGELSPRSSLRRLFESAPNAAAIACYADDSGSLQGLIGEVLGAQGVRASPDAMAYLCGNLGADRMISRNELEKLALYAGEGGHVDLEDAQACVGDSAAAALDDIVFAAGSGEATTLAKSLHRGFAEGIEPIAILRGVQRHFHRLLLCAGRIGAGTTRDQALKSLQPPVFFKRVGEFRSQLGRWPTPSLEIALAKLTEAEIACKSTGIPARAVCENALMGLKPADR